MTRWRQSGGVALLLLASLWTATDGACLENAVADDGFPELLASGGNYNPKDVTLTICKSSCVDAGTGEAAVEDGTVCLCGTGDQLSGLSASTSCSATCSADGAECGGPDGQVTGEAVPPKTGPIDLTPITAPATATGAGVEAAGSTIVPDTDFVVNPGDGSPSFVLTGSTTAPDGPTEFTTSLDYMVPGTYTISVSTSWAANSSQVTVQSAPLLLQVDCPPLVEPTDTYFCTAIVGGSGLTMTATFDDDNIPVTVAPPETPWQSVGHPPPRGKARTPVQMAAGEQEFTLLRPFTQRTHLMALHWHGAGAGDCQLTLMEGSCSDSSQAFCPSSGQCAAYCPLVAGTSNYSCDASEPTFCPFAGQCSKSDGTCATRAAPTLTATSVAPVDFTTAADTYGKLVLSASSSWAEPGWFAKVTCSTGAVSWMSAPADQGDMGAAATDKRYMVELVGLPQTPIGIVHTCAAMSEITLTVTDGGSASLTSTTSCQIPVGRISITLEQKGEPAEMQDTPPKTDSFSGAYFIESKVDVTFKVTIDKGAPVLLEYDFDEAKSGVAVHSENIQRPVSTSEVFTHTVQFASSGTFTVRVKGSNKHSTPEHQAQSEVTVTVQHPVTEDWSPKLSDASNFLVVVTGTKKAAEVVFEMHLPSTSQLPTDAYMDIKFGDDFSITDHSINLADDTPTSKAVAGHFIADFTHGFEKSGVFPVEITMKNRISEQEDTIEVVIEEEIIGLEASVQQNMDDARADELLDGMGDEQNQYRNDRNLTVTFKMVQGTVTKVTLFNETNNVHEEITSYIFNDKNNPTAEQIVFHIDTNQEIPLSFVAENTNQVTEPVTVNVIIQDPITEITNLKLALDDEQPDNYRHKNFIASWTSASTMQMCFAIQFGDDASPLVTYGDVNKCHEKYPKKQNMPPTLENPMKLQFKYTNKGRYNVFVRVFNTKGDETYELLVSVSEVACSNPIVSFEGSSEAREEAPKYLMSQNNVIEAHAKFDCKATTKTKRRWEASRIKTENSESDSIMYKFSDWTKADLRISKNSLPPGLYLLLYTMTITDDEIGDDDMLETQSKSYIEIVRTPLRAGFIKGSVSKIVRGWNQQIILDAITYSIDPDDQNSKDFTFKWYCRRLEEKRDDALNATTSAQSLTGRQAAAPVIVPDPGGCFGEGPGQLDFYGGNFDIDTEILQPYQQDVTFIITVVVSKDSRSSMAEVQVEMSGGAPPLIEVRCVDEILCSPSLEGVMVNPQNNLGLVGGCIGGDCTTPILWSWSISKVVDGTETAIENFEEYLSTTDKKEVSIKNTLFSDFPDVKFSVTLEASDGVSDKPGQVTYFVTVNKPPIVDGKLCRCFPNNTITSYAIIDTFTVECQMPLDPEEYAVEKFVFYTTVDDGDTFELMGVRKAPVLTAPLLLGVNQLHYIAEDQQGAIARKNICSITATEPTAEQLSDFKSKNVASLASTGDWRRAAAIATSKASLDLTVDRAAMTPEELTDADIAEADYIENILKALEQNEAPSKDSLDMKVGAIRALMSYGSDDSLKIGMNAIKLALSELESMAADVSEAGFATSDSMKSFKKNANMITDLIRDNVMRITKSESCDAFPLADLNKAKSAPVDTAPYYGEKPEIKSIEKQMKCNVRDTVRGEAKNIMERLNNVESIIDKVALQKMVLGDDMVTETPRGTSKLSVKTDLGGTNDTIGKAAISWPRNVTFDGDNPVLVSAKDTAANSRTTAKGADSISVGSHEVSVSVFDRNGKPLEVANISAGIGLKIPQTYRNATNGTCADCPPPPAKVNSTEALKGKVVAIVYSKTSIDKPHSALTIEFTVYDGPVDDIFVMISFGYMPTLRNHSLLKMLADFPNELSPEPNDTDAIAKYGWFVPGEWVDNRQGSVYVGVGQFNSSSPKYNDTMTIVYRGNGDFTKIRSKEVLRSSFTMTMYKLRMYTTLCAYYDEQTDTWAGEGVTTTEADLESIGCKSTHLTSFASGLFVQPNTIDFAYVFANPSFTDNLTIYMTLIILLVLYILLLIWARWQDKKDVEKLGALPLPDNKTTDKYLYEIMLFTGHKADAATDSNVSFVLTGDDYDSGTRTFGKPKRQFFRKGGQDAFVMAVPCYLGDLKYLRIWHDNSGRGRFASWYLQYVLVRNVQTGEMTTFVCNEWLAVEYDDGLIDRLIPVAGKEQMRDFATVFPHTSQQSLSDGHLWFSVFLRPPRSRFTRMQRVSCCFALLFLSMMVNAMWYERVPSKPSAGAIKFGPLSLSPEQIAVGVLSNIIVFVPSLLIVFLFRKSRPRKLRASRIDKAMQEGRGDDSKQTNGPVEDQAGAINQDLSSGSRKTSLVNTTRSGTPSKGKKTKKQRFTLPWWGVIIGWILCIICLFGSAFIVYSYGIMFGNEKTTKWVTSLFISLFSSILLIQPLKVFVSALIISAIFKNVDLGSDDANEDEQDPHLGSDEDWIMGSSGKTHSSGSSSSPYDKETLERIRKQRLKEIEMGVIVREIISYSFFLWILFVLSFDNRDPNAFYLQKNLENAFIKIGDHTGFTRWLDFSRVTNTSAFWYWSRNVILQEIRAQSWYNSEPAYGLRGMLDDRVNRILGEATMRQVRSRPDTCTIHAGMRSLMKGCQGYTSIVSEDTDRYCANWTRSGNRADCSRKEYHYESSGALQNLPTVAKQDVYGGGGFVFRLTGRQEHVLKQMDVLENENWIDSLTRAVFIEFSVYNAQVNLFGVATIYVEMTPGGGMHPMWRFDGVRLTKQPGSQAFVIICEILYLLFIIYFIVREIRLIRKQKKAYFKQYSSYAEWAIILLSFAGVIVYIMRSVATDSVMTTFKKTYGNGYVRLSYAQLLDDLYGYIVGIIVFIATLKFIKLLRFNRRIGMLSATLKQTWNDLTGFLLIFTIAIGSFGLLFNLLLMTSMDEFKDWISAVEACFAMMLNRFEFMEMMRGSMLAAIMFFLFAIYMNLIFVNVLLTIILKGFEHVKNDVTSQPNDYEMVDFVMRRFKKFIGINTVTPLRDVVAEHQREQEESKNVRQLPDKVSTFIDQINHTYFDGKLDLNDKKLLKKTLRQAKHEQRGRPKSMEGFQRDEQHMSNDQQLLDQL